MYLDTNAQPEPTQGAVDQQPEEKAEVKFVLDRWEEGKEARKEYDKDWEKFREYYKGRTYKNRIAGGKAEAGFNIIRSTIQSTIPILTDSRPGFTALPKDPTDYAFAKNVSAVVEHVWENRTMDHTLVEILMDALILSGGIAKVTWNADLEDGLGDVDVPCIDPNDIFIPKNAVDFDKNCPWVIHRTTKKVGYLRSKFPDVADQIHADTGGSSDKQKNKATDGDVQLVSPVDTKSRVAPPYTPQPGDDQLVEVLECWIDAEGLDEYEAMFEKGEENPIGYKKKYPNGKLVTVIPQSRLLLQCVPNPYKDGKKPFVRFVDTILPRQFWGEGETEPLITSQQMINKVVSTIMDYMNLTGNPVWMNPTTSGVDSTQITNAIGQVIPYTPGPNGERPERDIPPPLPSYYFEFLQNLLRMSDTISGIQEVTQGRRPAGVTAAQAIDTLQEAAQTRIRLKERNMNGSLAQMGSLMVSRILQFYTTPRAIKITGNTEWPEFFQFHVQDVMGEDGQPTGQVQSVTTPYTMTDEKTGYQPGQTVATAPSRGLFDIKIQSGTAMPTAKAERGNLAMALYNMQPPVIDQEAVLDAVDFPDKDQVKQRMDLRAQQEAQAQQAAQQQAAQAEAIGKQSDRQHEIELNQQKQGGL